MKGELLAKDVVLKITGDASGAVRALQQVTQSAAQAQGRLQKMQKNFQQYLLKTEIANRGLKSRSLINARADQIAAFERSHKFLTAQTQELYRQKYLNQQIAKSDTANWRQKLAARRQLLQLENKIAQAQQNNKKWATQYFNANKSWHKGQFYTGPISTPEQYAKASPVPASVFAKQLGRSAMGHFSTGQNALFGAMGTAAMATGAIYSFMRFVEPGGDVAQLVKNIKSVTGNDVSDLATEVKRLGRTTPYTTRQVAQAAYTMSKAGYDAKSIREMISGSVYMGLATDTDPNAAADITAQTLSHFGLKANMARRVTNLYSKAMVSSPAGLTDLAYTMQYAAPAAMLAKTDFSTTLAMSGILAKNGLKGSKAGTGLRAIFTKLSTAETNKSAKISLDTLGIKTKDLKGNLKPVTVLFAELNKSLKNLPTTAKTAHLKNIFGQIAMGAASILIEKSGDNNELVKYIQELREGDNANIAAVIAKQKQDSFQGDLYSLSSAWEGVRIAVFDAVEEKLRSNAQGLTDLSLKTAEWINQNEKSVQQWFDIGKYIVAAIGSSAALQVAFGLCSYAAGGIKLVLAGVGTVASGLVTVCEGIAAALGLSAAAGGALAFAVVAIPGAILLAIKYQKELLELQDQMIGKLDYLKMADFIGKGLGGEEKNKLAKGTDNRREFLKLSPEEQEKALDQRTIEFLNAKYERPQGTVPMIDGKPLPDYRKDNWYFQQIRQQILRQTLRSEEKKARNRSEYEYLGTPEYAYQQQLKDWDKHRAEIEKEFGVLYGTAQLREQIAAAKSQRGIFDNILENLGLGGAQQDQVASAPAAVPGIGAQAGGTATEGQQAQVAAAPAALAAPAITPEILQTLAAQAKPTNNTVTVGGTQVSVSVHCDASSIQTFVNQVVEAAKPQIEAIITAQIEKVKGALNSMGAGKKATAASML